MFYLFSPFLLFSSWQYLGNVISQDLCDELITRPGESYRLWCVVVCDSETSRMRRPWSTGGLLCQKKNPQDTILKNQLHVSRCRLQ